MRVLVTGGAGFIGSHFCDLIVSKCSKLVVLDKLTYAGNVINLEKVKELHNFEFVQGDINDYGLVSGILKNNKITHIVNFAAESHVDNSIENSYNFIETNIVGTHNLLLASLDYWKNLPEGEQKEFRYLQISTDEVYGSLGKRGAFKETTRYDPRSPYSASKAAADHLVDAWYHTYGLPTIITHCSNNYGPRQHIEKLIPKVITKALRQEQVPIYGTGENIRDWIHVEDHCKGIWLALTKGEIGNHYCFGGNQEYSNVNLVTSILKTLDILSPKKVDVTCFTEGNSYVSQILYTTDRLGHDQRYAVNFTKAYEELEFLPRSFLDLNSTIKYYIEKYEK